jgi:hypothetical protein
VHYQLDEGLDDTLQVCRAALTVEKETAIVEMSQKTRLARFIFFALRWKQQVDGQTVTLDREKWCPSGTIEHVHDGAALATCSTHACTYRRCDETHVSQRQVVARVAPRWRAPMDSAMTISRLGCHLRLVLGVKMLFLMKP